MNENHSAVWKRESNSVHHNQQFCNGQSSVAIVIGNEFLNWQFDRLKASQLFLKL